MTNDYRIGQGFDVHPFAPDRKLILGGVEIPYELGLMGHSDADVLSHAIGDALLGAAALGDLGDHFPPEDPQWTDVNSLELLTHIERMVWVAEFYVVNVDATLILEKPIIAPFRDKMRKKIARALKIDIDRVSVKATTTEKLGFTGRGEGIAALAVALLRR